MRSVADEAAIVARDRGSLPRFALRSTGSAAADLFDDDPAGYSGRSNDPNLRQLLEKSMSYALIARRIGEEIGRQHG